MDENKQYKCVNCGEPAEALYRTYGPSVLKLNKCGKCKGVVDKYIEYDPVIVMIDLVLVSKEAQRHVIYNTEFKSYWKLFIILMLLETYAVWRNDSLFNMTVNSLCDIKINHTMNTNHLMIPFNISMPDFWKQQCSGWVPEQKGDDSYLFIWEKDFYIKFITIFSGIIVFILTVHSMMKLLKPLSSQNETCVRHVVKAFSLGNVSLLLSLPMLVWGAGEGEEGAGGEGPRTRAIHYALVAAYTFVVFLTVFTVLYECPMTLTACVLLTSNCFKNLTMFHVTPMLRSFVT